MSNLNKNKKIITFGSFDLFHIGHLRILEKAKQYGDYLIVGISTDELNEAKGKKSIFSLQERLEIVKSLKCVDEVFIEESLEKKDVYIKTHGADVLIMGDDWKDKFNWVSCPVIYLERTPNISTTYIKNNIAMLYKNN